MIICSYCYCRHFDNSDLSDYLALLKNFWAKDACTWRQRYLDTAVPAECPYCTATLKKQDFHRYHPSKPDVMRLITCQVCGWWQVNELSEVGGLYTRVGDAKHYDIEALDVPIADLRRFLARQPNHVAHVNPTIFEKLMQSCLRSAYGGCEVVHLGKAGDKGIDLKLVTTDKETFLIQVKRRGNLAKKESVKVVRELNGVLFREGFAKGMVISSARSFTKAAQEEANVKTGTRETYQVKLLAFGDVVSMLQLPLEEPYEPWKKHCLRRFVPMDTYRDVAMIP